MASKFFTWTKGDRRNATETLRIGGLVRASEDASETATSHDSPSKGSISRMRSPKLGRRPKALTLVPPKDPHSVQAASPNSLALQDAAVASATNLLAVVNDILWSPPLSTSGAPRSPLHLSLSNGRSRSHTAPTTPMGETMPIAELPGSLLQENEGYPISHRISGGKKKLGPEETLPGLSLEFDINRPHTNPREDGGISKHKRSVSESSAIVNLNKKQDSDPPLPQIHNNFIDENPDMNNHLREAEEKITINNPDQGSSHRRDMTSNQSKLHRPNDCGSKENDLTLEKIPYAAQQTDLTNIVADRDCTITLLTAQLTSLRRSHDAYIASLSQAHEKELGALKLYANYLEEKQSLPAGEISETSDKGKLRLETALHSSQFSAPGAEGNSAISMSSFQSSFDEHHRASQEMAVEVNNLKRKLSSAQKRDAEADSVRKERLFLREAVRAKQQHVELLMVKLTKAQTNAKAVNNTADAFEARLEIANAQKTDVLEENHELRQAALNLHNRERATKQEIRAICQRWNDSESDMRNRLEEAEERAHQLERALQVFRTNQDTRPALVELNKHILRLEKEESDRNHYVTRLEQELRQCRFQLDNKHLPDILQPTTLGISSRRRDSTKEDHASELAICKSQVLELSNVLDERDASIRLLQAERDKVTALLQTEICAQARNTSERKHPTDSVLSPEVNVDQALMEVRARAHASLESSNTNWKVETDTVQRIEQLEKEIEYHVKDIVLYKLDVKGYKKDLKRANAKIQRLQGLSVQTSPNPGSISDSHRTSSNAPISASSQSQLLQEWPESPTLTGLGIISPTLGTRRPPRKDSLLPPTPLHNNSSSNVSLAPPPPSDNVLNRTPSASPSISPRPRTPAATNKRLPRTPMTPPSSKSPTPAKGNESSLVLPAPTTPLNKSPRPRRSTDARARATTSAVSAGPDPGKSHDGEPASFQHIDRSLSDPVLDTLSGSPQPKASLSLYPHSSTTHGTRPVLMGSKNNAKKPTGRRTKSANVPVNLSSG